MGRRQLETRSRRLPRGNPSLWTASTLGSASRPRPAEQSLAVEPMGAPRQAERGNVPWATTSRAGRSGNLSRA